MGIKDVWEVSNLAPGAISGLFQMLIVCAVLLKSKAVQDLVTDRFNSIL